MESAPDLSGKVALVTGASRGIGRALALALGKQGAHVIALARTPGGLEELDDDIRKAGGKASLIPADLADAAVVDRIGPALAGRFEKIDILVLNAAQLGALSPLADYDDKTFARVMEVNFGANRRLLRGLEPLLRASGGARIAVLSSRIGGETAEAYWGLYAASKAALERMMETYAREMRITGLRVAIIDPGRMRTKLRAEAMPGEDPNSLPPPETVIPLFFRTIAHDYDGTADRFVLGA
jgi:NAD(P)-dependent dehydrogenase (short-subunit alcohol dehydrogenase family)